jgi:hypothetical protein
MRKDDWSIFWKPHVALTAAAMCTLLPFWLGWLPLLAGRPGRAEYQELPATSTQWFEWP